MFTESSILQLFQKHWNNVNESDIKKIVSENGGISAFECVLMYLHILDTRPRHIIEFSPNHGYSTQAIAMAQRKMRNRWAFATFDISKGACAVCERRMTDLKLDDYCHVIQGNANVEVPKYIETKGAHVDFVFIDSDHRAGFAKNYIKGIFPVLQPGCLVGVHDIAAGKLTEDGKSGYKSSLNGGKHKGGEEKPLKDYIKEHKLDWSVLHSITGGKHEKADLPNNDKLYNPIMELTGINFRKMKKGAACPKTLFLRLKE